MPSWAKELPFAARDAEVTSVGGLADEFVYGYDAELRQGWRMRAADKRQRKEPSLRLEAPAGALDSTPAVAVWHDGHSRAIPQITAGDLAGGGRKSDVVAAYTAEHVVTHHKVVVRRRQDRHLLVSLCDQQRQVVKDCCARLINVLWRC